LDAGALAVLDFVSDFEPDVLEESDPDELSLFELSLFERSLFELSLLELFSRARLRVP
jgi:hypothetical protein